MKGKGLKFSPTTESKELFVKAAKTTLDIYNTSVTSLKCSLFQVPDITNR